MRMPRVRFTVRRMMVAVAVVAVVVAVVRFLAYLPTGSWVGSASIPLEFLILDASTGRPIAGATVRLVEPDSITPVARTLERATTGPDGKAKIVIVARTTGPLDAIGSRRRHVDYGRWSLAISADGYRVVEENDTLWVRTRDPLYHSEGSPPPIVVRLQTEPSKP